MIDTRPRRRACSSTSRARTSRSANRFASYAERKLSKLDKQVHELTRVEIELAVEKNPSVAENQVAEATVWLKGHTLRAREATRDMKASIDELTEKLVRQIREERDKKVSKRHIDKHAHDDGPSPSCSGLLPAARAVARATRARGRPHAARPAARRGRRPASTASRARASGTRRSPPRRRASRATPSAGWRSPTGRSSSRKAPTARSIRSPTLVETKLAPPYRARGARQVDDVWAVQATQIEVVALPGAPDGETIDVSRNDGTTTLAVDGHQVFGSLPALEQRGEREGPRLRRPRGAPRRRPLRDPRERPLIPRPDAAAAPPEGSRYPRARARRTRRFREGPAPRRGPAQQAPRRSRRSTSARSSPSSSSSPTTSSAARPPSSGSGSRTARRSTRSSSRRSPRSARRSSARWASASSTCS